MPSLPRSGLGLTLLALFASGALAQQGKRGQALGRSDGQKAALTSNQMTKSVIRSTQFEWSELLRLQESLPPNAFPMEEVLKALALQPQSTEGVVVDEVEVDASTLGRSRRDHVRSIDETPGTPGGIERLGPCVGFPAAPAASLSTAGQGDGPDGFATLFYPPNPAGAVGPNHLMVMAPNLTLIQTRLGASLGAVNTITFWSPTGAASVTHCRVYYDDVAGRWHASALGGSGIGGTSILYAISDTDSPAGGWDFYSWDADPTFTTFADHPKMGFGSVHVLIVADMFLGVANGQNRGTRMYILDKDALVNATPVTLTISGNDDWAIMTGVFPGSFVNWRLQPSRALDTSDSTVWIWNSRATSGANILFQVGRLVGTGPAPAFAFPFGSGLFLPTYNYTNLRIAMTQLAPEARGIDPLPPDGQQASNRARFHDSVIRNGHNFLVNSTGQPGGNSIAADRNNVNFYEVDVSASPFLTPFVQAVPITDGVGNSLAFPSVAVNCANDVLIGMTRANSGIYLTAATAMRLGTDPLNTMGAVTDLKSITLGDANWWQDAPAPQGNAGVAFTLPGLGAWGHYSSAAVDPNDNTTLWTLQPYAELRLASPGVDADSRWGTWWGRFGDCETLPVITTQPTGHSGCVGDNVTFTVSATTGANPLTYQWRLDGMDIPGATTTSYSLTPSVFTDEGTYDCVICGCGQVISDPAVLDFNQPTITTQPTDTFTPLGGNASFFVAATPFLGSLDYQWYHEGNPVGTNSDTLQIIGAIGQDYGEYHVDVTDDCGLVTSVSVLLEPDHELNKHQKTRRIMDMVVEPTSQLGCVGDSVEFHVLAAPPGSTYVWRKNGVAITPAETNDTLVLSGLTFASAAHYDVLVDTGSEVIESHDGEVVMADNPVITDQPNDVTVSSSMTVFFEVVATGEEAAGPLKYQWRFEPATSQGFNNIPGAIGPMLSIDNVSSANAGRYRCNITNRCGVTISRTARLTIL
jgi:hypothetical protein